MAPASDICIGEPSEIRRNHLEETYSVRTTTDNLEAIEGAKLTVLAVKPQTLPYVYPELKGNLPDDNTDCVHSRRRDYEQTHLGARSCPHHPGYA